MENEDELPSPPAIVGLDPGGQDATAVRRLTHDSYTISIVGDDEYSETFRVPARRSEVNRVGFTQRIMQRVAEIESRPRVTDIRLNDIPLTPENFAMAEGTTWPVPSLEERADLALADLVANGGMLQPDAVERFASTVFDSVVDGVVEETVQALIGDPITIVTAPDLRDVSVRYFRDGVEWELVEEGPIRNHAPPGRRKRVQDELAERNRQRNGETRRWSVKGAPITVRRDPSDLKPWERKREARKLKRQVQNGGTVTPHTPRAINLDD
ncbi:hypothetical protein J2J97_32355 (plasmid) [Rhizobium bangladeshense]|uniref:hypothetical protein n=1 Tax=Rhizobium bangladeshense TaxID=1138189 RepID=UPI001A99C8E3|nr:hypothetical protein [Rhizobium bangladeshense]QSY98598.1 hypothetical protein J2J97_32355 [Rhizobium bangladeshense]